MRASSTCPATKLRSCRLIANRYPDVTAGTARRYRLDAQLADHAKESRENNRLALSGEAMQFRFAGRKKKWRTEAARERPAIAPFPDRVSPMTSFRSQSGDPDALLGNYLFELFPCQTCVS